MDHFLEKMGSDLDVLESIVSSGEILRKPLEKVFKRVRERKKMSSFSASQKKPRRNSEYFERIMSEIYKRCPELINGEKRNET